MPAYSFLKYRRLLDHPPAADPFALRVTRSGAENRRGDHVLYWMQSARRIRANLALEYAVREAERRKLPLIVCEADEAPAATPLISRFVRDGMAWNRRDAEARGFKYVSGDALAGLAPRAALVVTDEFPTREIRDATRAFRARTDVPLHLVDGNGILPMRMFEKEQYSARFFRDRAHKLFDDHWVAVPGDGLDDSAAAGALRAFIAKGLHGYATLRNRSLAHTSGLSPYLHFGHIGIGEVAREILPSGAPHEDIDAFLEEAIIRRELSFNLCFYREDHDSLSALPDWAKRTLDAHRRDRRSPQFTREQMERAETYDQVWNLAQRQLLALGTIHGYLRMLWGKKIIEWSPTPEEAHATMVALHEKYALDGRDPNTHAGILWCFGKHDRPWAPERPIFGIIRYMSSESAAKKVLLKEIEVAIMRPS